MARSRRGGSSSSGGGLFGSRKKEAPAPAPRAAPRPAPPAPAPAAHPPAPMQQQSSGGGMLSGIGSTIAQGMAFGTGSAIAHRAVGAVANSFGGDSSPAEQTRQYEAGAPQIQQDQLQGPCAQDKQMFFDCLKVNRGDQQACSFLYEQLQSCQRTETTFN
ncbi:hypothetical protein ACHAW6_013550 [Cyclotella cf. meneghiniana]